MTMFPHTVTVYNKMENDMGVATYNITLLRGVFLDISKAANVIKSGLTSADSVMLYIPMSIKAINAETGEEQRFVSPKEYERLEDDERHAFWTLRVGGSSSVADCFFHEGRNDRKSKFWRFEKPL